MDKERFSLLLLEPGEIYFEDFYVTLKDPNALNNEETYHLGHLKMCSKSLVFDPKDNLLPIIKIPFKDCKEIKQWDGTLCSKDINVLLITAQQYIEMLEGNILAPYNFKTETRTFLFSFHYAQVDGYLSQFCQLHRASSLHACEQNSMIATIVYSRHNRVKFNPLWLDNIYEEVIAENYVNEIKPLVVNPGRLLLSCASIYFQAYNNINAYPVMKIKLKFIQQMIKRRFLLRHTGLEIKWVTDNKNQTLYVTFSNQTERDAFYERTMEQEDLKLETLEQKSMTLKWQNGLISNYDYLLYLNSLADRTFQDLTQYPIFPWVISNYTDDELDLTDPKNYRDLTKPIGALNTERLARLKERCEEMGEPKFLYGSHYSAPGLVLFYLVRKYPNLMLCLQNGRFDHPDRMFNRLDDTFNNCLNNMSDFKELIPEFYDPSNSGDFLINTKKINFGHRFDGTPVNHVELPPWAKRSTEKFIELLRQGLESDFVSENLHFWIDLIFGYKQRGEEALKADNLFYYLCYEGAVDLDNVTELAARHALEVQISEFGQIPKQLFKIPHAPKIMSIPPILQKRNSRISRGNVGGGDDENAAAAAAAAADYDEDDEDDDGTIRNLKLTGEYLAHKDIITSILIDGNILISTGKDGILKCYDILEGNQMRSVSMSPLPISSCIKIPDSNTIILGSWDNTIITYNFDFGRISNVNQAHDDAVSCLAYIDSLGILISGSWDCSIKVWKGYDLQSCDSNPSNYRIDSIISYLSLEEKVTCLNSFYDSTNLIRIIFGTYDGDILLWTLTIVDENSLVLSGNEPKLMQHHGGEVSAVSFNYSGTKIASCGMDKMIYVIDVASNMILYKKTFVNGLVCMNWTRCDELLLLGDQKGEIFIWDVLTGDIECNKKVHKDSVTSISTSKDNKLIATAGKDDCYFYIKMWSAAKLE